MIDLAKMNAEERDEIRQRQGYKKILDTCQQARSDKYELALAASTNEAAQNYPKPSVLYIGGTQTRGYATLTSMTSRVPSFPLKETTGNIPSQMAGQSGFLVGGRSRR